MQGCASGANTLRDRVATHYCHECRRSAPKKGDAHKGKFAEGSWRSRGACHSQTTEELTRESELLGQTRRLMRTDEDNKWQTAVHTSQQQLQTKACTTFRRVVGTENTKTSRKKNKKSKKNRGLGMGGTRKPNILKKKSKTIFQRFWNRGPSQRVSKYCFFLFLSIFCWFSLRGPPQSVSIFCFFSKGPSPKSL